MKIPACIIIKDDQELPILKKAVASIKPYVDGIYITANGKEVSGIGSYCKDEGLHYSYLAWDNDFSAQRNFNFSQAPQDADYIFWMDTDDILYGAEHLREVAEIAKQNRHDLVFFTYWYGCLFNGEPSKQTLADIEMEHMRERLIRPGTHRWEGRLHETPIPISGARNNYTKFPYDPKNKPIAVMHTATIDKAFETMKRNKDILEIQLAEEREKGEADPRTLLNLMKIYAEDEKEENYPKVFEMGEEYLKKSGWDEERGTCCEQMAIVSGKMGNHKDAITYLHRAISEWPSQVLFYIRLAGEYFNVKNYRSAKHWLEIAGTMTAKQDTAGLFNFKAMKLMYTKLLVEVAYKVDRNLPLALQAARKLYEEDPTDANRDRMTFIANLNDLNEASQDAHKLAKYLKSIGREDSIGKMLNALPDEISTQPLFLRMRRDVTPPRRWERDEICYFANFGGNHFEKWDSTSLDKGIGGSETAVIRLAEEWVKQGYRVTVYGDPFIKGVQNGVNYLPWYYFNHKDSFNIFIQWRSWALSTEIKARKFYVDLHDVFSGIDITKEEEFHVDKFMVKSQYHRSLAPNIPDDKFTIISNGL